MEFSPGQTLHRYELVAFLGRGATAEVWEATLRGPSGFSKPVALKLPHPDGWLGQAGLAREARLGASLHHPNVVSISDFGTAEGQPYIAMELVRGSSLSHLIVQGLLPPSAVLDVGIQACAGLQHIHELGLVHRDIKPGNLLVDRAGLVQISDLGVAELLGNRGDQAGTPGYMPPEQLDGRVDARSDVFALGVALWNVVTRQRPWASAETTAHAVRDVELALANPDFLAPLERTARGLGEVVRHCLHPDPADRWGSAAAVGAALASLEPRTPGTALHAVVGRVPTPTGARWRVPDRAPTTGPVSLDAFVGREGELADLRERVESGQRLLTLIGPGGVGKTRLAHEAGRRLSRHHPDGVTWVDLAEAHTVASVCSAVARELGVPLAGGQPAERVGAALAERGRVLLVLDNLEQVLDAAPTIARWSAVAPEATLLCTSRQALRVKGEHRVAVPSLPVPEAAALFVERADLAVAPAPGEVERLVGALDGLPLAIELAASRTRMMSVPQLLTRLNDRLRLLAGADRDRPLRHRSLRASLDASWELLGPAARRALAQLSVFEGGATLTAADAVLDLGDGGAWALDALDELVGASLVRYEPATGRFTLPVLVRDYAREELEAGQFGPATRDRHAAWFAQYGTDEAVLALFRPGGIERLDGLIAELANVVAACRRAIEVGEVRLAVAAGRAAFQVLRMTGPSALIAELSDGVLALPGLSRADRVHLHCIAACAARQERRFDIAERLLDLRVDDLPPRVGSHLFLERGQLETERCDSRAARIFFEQALQAAREGRDARLEAVVYASLAQNALDQRHLDDGERFSERAVRLAQATGDERLLGLLSGFQAQVHLERGRMVDAERCLLDALTASRRVGDRYNQATALGMLGHVYRSLGRPDDARAAFGGAEKVHREFGDPRAVPMAQAQQGLVHQDEGQDEEARELLQASLALLAGVEAVRAEAVACLALGEIEASRADGAHDALRYFERADRVCSTTGDRWLEALCSVRVAVARTRLDLPSDPGVAVEALRWLESPLERAWLEGGFAELASARGEDGEAWRAFARAEAEASLACRPPNSPVDRMLLRTRAALLSPRPLDEPSDARVAP